MIALLGARFAADSQIQQALEASLALLSKHRAPNGAIPNHVDSVTLRPNFRAYADGGLWWVIGNTLLTPDLDAVREVLRWYEYQDVDQSGLLSMQESSDWQDLFCTRGKGLYLNCLYVLALRCAAKLFPRAEAEGLRSRAEFTAQRINQYFWYSGEQNLHRHLALTFSTDGSPWNDSLGRPRHIPKKRYLSHECFYLPYLAFRSVGEWFDAFGNMLAILAGVADERQSATILDFVQRYEVDKWPLRSLMPVVRPGDPDWRDYYGSLNLPHHYHNGGVWPFLGGFYVAALTKCGRVAEAVSALEKLAQLDQCGRFNEWHHGQTGAPMGAQDQAWSAGMYLLAWDCVQRGALVLPGAA